MAIGTVQQVVALSVISWTAWSPLGAIAADADDVRTHAEPSFERLKQQGEQRDAVKTSAPQVNGTERSAYSPDHYLIGQGQGDMAKGPLVCQRVSELSARADLAKQIRVLVKEHMIDRIRERTGRNAEQSIEVTREEIVQEYLQGVNIVDRHIDEANKTCSATAVMPKNQIQPGQASEQPGLISPIVR